MLGFVPVHALISNIFLMFLFFITSLANYRLMIFLKNAIAGMLHSRAHWGKKMHINSLKRLKTLRTIFF